MGELTPEAARPAGARAAGGNPGLVVYRASRLEALLEPLLHLLDTCPPADVLAPQLVIAAHAGIKKWLPGVLARRRGAAGIVANLELQLPSTWLDASAVQYLGESAVALNAYRSESLRWRIHALLPSLRDARIDDSLRGDTSGLRRYQLSDRLAKLYIQYLMYRPDWLAAWQNGRPAAIDAGFQPELWRRVRNEVALAHRGELLERLIARLRNPELEIAQDPLHFFGISHLAPAELRLLTALAGRRPVFLYVPDPSARYWGDGHASATRVAYPMGLPAVAARRKALTSGDVFEAGSESMFLDEVSHPLLASWGRMGQHFMLALEAGDVAIDVRHWEDEVALADLERQPRLARVQASIRELDPELPTRAADALGDDDASLTIHSCHTRLRELEVLRDALLAARSDIPKLKPSEIAVLAPDIAAYLPLLGAVFGPAGNPNADLPYHLADVSVARTHPLFTAFTQLLGLPQSRMSAPEVVDLLRIPQVSAALGIDPGGVDTLIQWLERAGVAWGLDGGFRAARFGVPANEEFGFAWGVERLLAGYVFGQESPGRAVNVPGSTGSDASRLWPVEGIDGPASALVGALDSLLMILASVHRDAAQPRKASEWSELLLSLVDKVFRIDRRDRDAREALATLRGIIDSLGSEAKTAGDPGISFEVARDVLLDRLSAASDRQHLLMGGITVSGMVAARAIPFRVIAVLGLNDGDFPRQASGSGLDLTLQPGNRRLGDRDVRNDDRYLFLETLMAARTRLHLSYIGEGVQDGKARNPAAPLAELMAFLERGTDAEGTPPDEDKRRADKAADIGQPAPALLRPWHIRHPLQPFDARYFEGGGRLYSFDTTLADIQVGTDRPAGFIANRKPDPEISELDVPLRSVIGWFKDPARHLLTSTLQLRLDALEDGALAADEPLEPAVSAIDRIPRRLALEALLAPPARRSIPDEPPDWLKLDGKLPAGHLGALAWAGKNGVRASATNLLASLPAEMTAVPLQRTPATVTWREDGMAIAGEVHDLLADPAAQTLWVFDAHAKGEEKLDFKQRIPLFLQWALLRLATRDDVAVRICLLVVDKARNPMRDWRNTFAAWCDRFADVPASREEMRADLGRRVRGLLDVYRNAQRETVWYFPRTSWASLGDDCVDAVQKAWAGDERRTGEMDYSPGYAGLLARGTGLEDAACEDVLIRMQASARLLNQLIELDRALPSPESPTSTGETIA